MLSRHAAIDQTAIDQLRVRAIPCARSPMNPTANFVPPVRPRRHAGLLIFAALTFTLLEAGLTIFFGVGRWLVVESPLEKAQAIVVLTGGMPIRAIEAARLYHAGYAPQIWLTRPAEPAASLDSMAIPNSGEDFFNARVLEHEGVPSGAIRVLEPAINNTADEVRATAAELSREHGSVVIIVTTKAHTRRVGRLWRQLAADRGRAAVRTTPADPFDAAHWWRSTHDALDVVREVLGLLNAWAGFPLHAKS
jgi:uncharacterized SAM-binding protein YcdF (DUF218 family)